MFRGGTKKTHPCDNSRKEKRLLRDPLRVPVSIRSFEGERRGL